MSDRKRRKSGRKRLTAEERADFARQRRELIGKLIIQDDWEGAIVLHREVCFAQETKRQRK